MTSFTRPQCGETHHDLPALAYASPQYYYELSDEQQEAYAKLNDDFCSITRDGRTDYFIRVVLRQPIIDSCVPLDYGLWVSLSEKNYYDYSDNFNNPDHRAVYFGWLSSWVPDYPSTLLRARLAHWHHHRRSAVASAEDTGGIAILIAGSGYTAFPPRLPEQLIFYPVLNFAYAE